MAETEFIRGVGQGTPRLSFRSNAAMVCRSKLALSMLLLAFGCGLFMFCYKHGGLLTGKSRWSIEGYDDCCYYFWVRSVVVDHDVDFTNEINSYNSWDQSLRQSTARQPRTPLGLPVNRYPIGWSLVGLPWFMMADLLSGVLNLAGNRVTLDGWGPIYQMALMIGQGTYAFLSMCFACGILLRLFPARFAVPGVTLAWLASPLYIYQTAHLSMSHSVMFFAVTGAWYFSLRIAGQPEVWKYWVITGCFCGLTVIVRNQGVLMLFYPAALWLQLVIHRPQLLRNVAFGAGGFLSIILLQIIAWKLLFGSFLVYSYGSETFTWLHPHVWKILFSSFHGWFNWHPAMAIGSFGFLLWVWREKSLMAWCFLASSLAYLYVNAAWDCWWFGASFGARAFESSTLFVMIGTAHLLELTWKRRALFTTLLVVSLLLVAWNLNLVWIAERAGGIPWEKPLTNAQKFEISRKFWSGKPLG